MRKIAFLFSLLLAFQGQAQQTLRGAFQPTTKVHKIPYGANISAGNYVQTQDAKIYYEVYGQGQPVVLLHGGILGSTIEMAEFIDSLKKNFQVIGIIPNTGHVCFAENFPAVWAGIVPFLKN